MRAEGSQFHILSLDGGGTWALIQVRALMDLYGADRTGHEVLRHFDLAIANSGGSIVLAALALDRKLKDVFDLFQQAGARDQIFKFCFGGELARRVGAGPRYRTSAKLEGLRWAFGKPGDERMRDWQPPRSVRDRPVRLVVCGFDYERLREVFFRTQPETADEPPVESQEAIRNATFADAVHASSNAPVLYFDAPATFESGLTRFWDGAMGGYNNPVLAGVVEALTTNPGLVPSQLRVLSIGTGSVVLPENGTGPSYLRLPRRGECFSTYLATAGTCILDDPPDAASYVAHVMLGGRVPTKTGDVVRNGHLVRMSPLVQPVGGGGKDWALPHDFEEARFKRLILTQLDAITQTEVDDIVGLTSAWLEGEAGDDTAVRNQPIRADRWLRVEIGHGTYGGAKAAWEMLTVPRTGPSASRAS